MLIPDVVRLRHMHEAVVIALKMSAGRSRLSLDSDPMLAMALTRSLEILGEAASKLSAEARLRFPTIPCVQMVSMRNRLIHAYFDVDLDIVWTTVSEDLPRLLPIFESALDQFTKQADKVHDVADETKDVGKTQTEYKKLQGGLNHRTFRPLSMLDHVLHVAGGQLRDAVTNCKPISTR